MSAKKPSKAKLKVATPTPSRWRRIVKWSAVLISAWLVLSLGVILALRFIDPPTTAFMEQREDLAEDRGEKHFKLRHEWVPLNRISPNLRLAVVAAEDQRFPQHHGFDVKAIEDAMEDRLEGKSVRGASTLTQQLAKNLFLWPGQSWVRKALEAYLTLAIELLWPKRRILEVYLNVAEVGDGVYGAEAASRRYFGKSAVALNATEASLLAAVLPNPKVRKVSVPSKKVLERAEWIREQMHNLGPDWLDALGD